MKPSQTQLDQVKKHLQDGNKITSWEAIQQYGITRLSRYIHTLKTQGMAIQDKWVESNKKRFKEYYLP